MALESSPENIRLCRDLFEAAKVLERKTQNILDDITRALGYDREMLDGLKRQFDKAYSEGQSPLLSKIAVIQNLLHLNPHLDADGSFTERLKACLPRAENTEAAPPVSRETAAVATATHTAIDTPGVQKDAQGNPIITGPEQVGKFLGRKVLWMESGGTLNYFTAKTARPNGRILEGELLTGTYGKDLAYIGTFDEKGILRQGRIERRYFGEEPKLVSEGSYDEQGRILEGRLVLPAEGYDSEEDHSGTFGFTREGVFLRTGRILVKGENIEFEVRSSNGVEFQGVSKPVSGSGVTIEGNFSAARPHKFMGGKITYENGNYLLPSEGFEGTGQILEGTEYDAQGEPVQGKVNAPFFNRPPYEFASGIRKDPTTGRWNL